MNHFNPVRLFILLLSSSLVFSSCKKANAPAPLGDEGKTMIKILGGGFPATVSKNIVTLQQKPQKLLLIQLRRDIPNAGELNKTVFVTIKDDTAAVAAANSAYVVFPSSWFSIEADGVTAPNQNHTYNFTFKPGEFAKEVYINIPDATVMNPNIRYALGFTIVSSTGGSNISGQRSSITEIVAGNQWDGVYRVDFCNYHPLLNRGYTCSTTVVHLITSGINKVQMYWPAVSEYASPSVLGGVLTYFASQPPELTIIPISNSVYVQNACQSCTGWFEMAVNWPNNYDPVTRTFNLKWGYSYTVPGVFDSTCREWTQTIKYLGPR